MSDYFEDLQINKYDVVELWEDHSTRFMQWGESYAEAVYEKDTLESKANYEKSIAKDDLEFIKSDVGFDVKSDYKNYGFSRQPSDKVVEMYINKNKKCQEALENLRDVTQKYNIQMAEANHKVNLLKIAKEAFEQRTKALTGLTSLLTGGFYSAKLPREIAEDVKGQKDQTEVRAREEVSETIRRRKERSV